MKKTTIGMGAVVVGLAMLTLSAVSAPAAERPGFETYVVRSGDTLSKISGRVFGDVKRWREILKENPQVTNANLIFPGDTLLVPVPETAAPSGGTGGDWRRARAPRRSARRGLRFRAHRDRGGSRRDGRSGCGRRGSALMPQRRAGPEPAPKRGRMSPPRCPSRRWSGCDRPHVVSPALYRSAGYIADKLPAIAIVASQDDRVLLGTDDAAIVNAPISPGTRFTVVRANRRVFHPVTGAYLGWLIRVLGSAEVTCRGERTSTVALRAMNDAASVGDYLVPIDPNDVLEQNVLAGRVQPECIPAGARDGVIVAFNEDRRSGRRAGTCVHRPRDRGGRRPGPAFHDLSGDCPRGPRPRGRAPGAARRRAHIDGLDHDEHPGGAGRVFAAGALGRIDVRLVRPGCGESSEHEPPDRVAHFGVGDAGQIALEGRGKRGDGRRAAAAAGGLSGAGSIFPVTKYRSVTTPGPKFLAMRRSRSGLSSESCWVQTGLSVTMVSRWSVMCEGRACAAICGPTAASQLVSTSSSRRRPSQPSAPMRSLRMSPIGSGRLPRDEAMAVL